MSPLENKQLIENDCSKCHDDLEKKVKDIQASEEERVTAISEKIEDMTNKIAAKYADEIAAMKAANEARPHPGCVRGACQAAEASAQRAVLLGFRDG